MSDALISPAVGGTMWALTLTVAGVAVAKTKKENLTVSGRAPLMGVMGAFVFAAQMLNFSIPGTGSSGHICGGLLLASLLGPWAAFLTLMVILAVQALFFADGGLLAYGCNVFNMGFFACLLAYPLLMKPLLRGNVSPLRLGLVTTLASVLALQLGALGVVLETVWSGRTELTFSVFALVMQPIHLAIGVGEGLITAAVMLFLRRAAPEVMEQTSPPAATPLRPLLILGTLALLCGGVLSWFASTHPDGLEWSLEKTASPSAASDEWQKKFAPMPDYAFKPDADSEEGGAAWPSVSGETSLAGVTGSAATLMLAGAFGAALCWRRRKV